MRCVALPVVCYKCTLCVCCCVQSEFEFNKEDSTCRIAFWLCLGWVNYVLNRKEIVLARELWVVSFWSHE